MMKDLLYPCFFLLMCLFGCTKSNNGSSPNSYSDKPQSPVTIVPEVEDKSKYLLASGSAGPFKIGEELPGPATMMKYDVRIEEMTRVADEGPVKESFTIIAENGNDLLWLRPGVIANEESDNSITEIIVVSSKYKTLEDIGVGSTIAEFQAAYPVHRIWYTYVSGMYVMETDQVEAQFIVDKSDFIGPEVELTSEMVELKIEDFNPNGKIRRVRLINYSHKL